MRVIVEDAWQGLVETLVETGRYPSAREVVEDGLRLLQERERKLDWLREKLGRSISEGGSFSDEEVGAALDAEAERLRAEGY